MILNKDLKQKYEKLKDIITDYKSIAVAYSGGVDSTLLAYVSKQVLGQNCVCVTAKTELISQKEVKDLKDIAEKYGFNHKILNLNVLEDKNITLNPPERCFLCKKLIFVEVIKYADETGLKNIAEGSNIDDLSDYRPGLKAIKELSIKSPLLEAGFNKTDIRHLSEYLGLETYNKPSLACMASRIPYYETLTREKLFMIEKSEDFLYSLGFNGFRVRYHGKIARIELNEKDLNLFIRKYREKVDNKLKEIGFNYVCLDICGYKTGSLNIF